MIRAALRIVCGSILLAGLAGGASCAAQPAPAPPPLAATLEVHARTVAPGEPLRVTVRVAERAARLTAEFLGRAVFLAADSTDATSWSGWTLVPLDATAATAALDVRGATAEGREVTGTLALAIEARRFPEERLSVESKYVEPPPDVAKRIAEERERTARVYARRTPRTSAVGPFVRPVPGEPTSVFGTRRLYNGEPRAPHPGLDLRATTGSAVRAAGPGEVALAADLYFSGGTVILDHGGGLFTVYAHLSKLEVEEGQRVEAGQVIARSGATGRVTGPHLHWGGKIGDEVFDPTALLDERLFD